MYSVLVGLCFSVFIDQFCMQKNLDKLYNTLGLGYVIHIGELILNLTEGLLLTICMRTYAAKIWKIKSLEKY